MLCGPTATGKTSLSLALAKALDGEIVVIADEAAARGIAGVMGGLETGCTMETVNVFIEAALFDRARTAASDAAQLGQDSFAYATQLAGAWRAIAIDAAEIGRAHV